MIYFDRTEQTQTWVELASIEKSVEGYVLFTQHSFLQWAVIRGEHRVKLPGVCFSV